MLTIEVLKSFGADTKDGLERCLNDEEFYLELVPSALERDSYEKVEKAVKSGDMNGAFEAAHALKGVLGNLALTPIYKPVSEMTEHLRARKTDVDYDSYVRKMWKERDRLEEMIGK